MDPSTTMLRDTVNSPGYHTTLAVGQFSSFYRSQNPQKGGVSCSSCFVIRIDCSATAGVVCRTTVTVVD